MTRSVTSESGTSVKAGSLKTVNLSERSALRAEYTSHPAISDVVLTVVCGRSPTGRLPKSDWNQRLSRGVGDPAHTIVAPVIAPARLEVYH